MCISPSCRGWEVQYQSVGTFSGWWGPSFWFGDGCLLLYSHLVERELWSLHLLTRAPVLSWGLSPGPHSNLVTSQRTLPPNTITWENRASTYGFGGRHKHSSIALPLQQRCVIRDLWIFSSTNSLIRTVPKQSCPGGEIWPLLCTLPILSMPCSPFAGFSLSLCPLSFSWSSRAVEALKIPFLPSSHPSIPPCTHCTSTMHPLIQISLSAYYVSGLD